MGCEVEFSPQITPLVLSTAATDEAFGTVVPAGTLSPAHLTGTAETAPILTAVAFANSRSANRRGDVRYSSYEEVWCGDIDTICYQLCFQLQCGIYDVANLRAQQFIDAVDMREDKIEEFRSGGRTKIALDFASFGSCAGTLVAGGGAYVLLTAADPEPVSKTILAIGGAIAAGVLCGGSLIARENVSTDQTVLSREIARQTLITEQAFDNLQEYGEEVELDAGQ